MYTKVTEYLGERLPSGKNETIKQIKTKANQTELTHNHIPTLGSTCTL